MLHTQMERPKPRILQIDVKTATYFGDWITYYEKAIQELTKTTISNTQTPQAQPHGNQ